MEQPVIEESNKAFARGLTLGQQLELLHAAVVAHNAYWNALKRLEQALTCGQGYSDMVKDAVIDAIDCLAAEAKPVLSEKDSSQALADLHDLIDQYPNAQAAVCHGEHV
jgi:hypothetical protein